MSQTNNRIDKAAQDDRILNAPLTLVMRVYGLSYPNARDAVKRATERCRKARTLGDVERRIEQDALVSTCRTAEEKYPEITKNAVAAVNHSALGQKHKITRERVRQIAETVRRLARLLGKSEAVIAESACRGKLPQTQRDELESSIAES